MLDRRKYERWIKAAKKTLESAYGDLERGDYNWACFKAQQAAEIAVKALLYGLGLSAYGHSISRLLQTIERKGVDITEDLMHSAKTLDKYYVPTKYPNVWVEGAPHEYYTRVDGLNAIQQARKIIE